MDVPLKRLCATCLVVLVLLPFTPPWSVCSAADVRAALTADGVKPLEARAHSSAPSMIPETSRDPATMIVAPIETRQVHLNSCAAATVRKGATPALSAPPGQRDASRRLTTPVPTARPPAASTSLRI
jgi:hypothetical protein